MGIKRRKPISSITARGWRGSVTILKSIPTVPRPCAPDVGSERVLEDLGMSPLSGDGRLGGGACSVRSGSKDVLIDAADAFSPCQAGGLGPKSY